MKNIIYLLIDSLNYKHVKESKVNLMPFFQKLKKEGICCENMYSEAPYTEAALMSSICGQDVLDYNGYIYRFKETPLTIFEAMQNKGYYTYTTSFEPQCHPSSVKRGIDEYLYMFGFDPAALWPYRYSHYSKLLKNKTITEKDYEVLFEITNDNLKSWEEWAVALKEGKECTRMIGSNSNCYDVDDVLNKVRNEIGKFNEDNKKYVDSILTKGKKHTFFKIDKFNQNFKAKNRKKVKSISKELKPLGKRIKKMDYKLNKKNCKKIYSGPRKKFVEMVKKPSINSLKNYVKALLGSANVLHDLDLNKRLNKYYDSFKDGPSLRTHIDEFVKWEKQYDRKKPYFAFLHANDIHNPEEFFTYDSDDIELIKKEIKDANELLDQIPSDYYGNLSHDLSLKYIDGVIKYLYDELEKNDALKDTIILICADHGFSFSGNPLRDSYVVNLYLENYNIPCLITGTDYKNVIINKRRHSKDIPATLCELADGNIPNEFSGNSILNSKEVPNIIEYCGGGCPDISRRELKIAAFDNEWFVGSIGNIYDEIQISEIYNLKNDPIQLTNLVNEEGILENEFVKKLIESIEKRRFSIKKQLTLCVASK